MSLNRIRSEIADAVVEDTGNLAKLVDEVVDGHAPIVVARDGEPKAALVSLADYARLKQEAQAAQEQVRLSWEEWFARNQEFQEGMLERRGNQPVDQESVDRAWREARTELEDRDSRNAGLGR